MGSFHTSWEPEKALPDLTDSLHQTQFLGARNVEVKSDGRGGYRVKYDSATGDSGYEMQIKKDPIEGSNVHVKPRYGTNDAQAQKWANDIAKAYFRK